jgi:hypothetical protein
MSMAPNGKSSSSVTPAARQATVSWKQFTVANLLELMAFLGVLFTIARIFHMAIAVIIAVGAAIVFGIFRPVRGVNRRGDVRSAAIHAGIFWAIYALAFGCCFLAAEQVEGVGFIALFLVILLPFLPMGSTSWLMGRRRYEALVLYVVLSPLNFGAVHAVIAYSRQKAVLPPRGNYFGPDNPDPVTRLQRATKHPNDFYFFEWVHDISYENTLIGLTRAFGPMRGTYAGPYPTEMQAREALRRGVEVPLKYVSADVVVIGDEPIIVHGISSWANPFDKPNPQGHKFAEFTATLWRDECLILGVKGWHDAGTDRPGVIVLFSRASGRQFARYDGS